MVSMTKRRWLYLAAALILLVLLGLGFRSPPVTVDSAQVMRGHFQQVIEEEGRTRLPDRYQVSAPVSGYISRITLEPGDAVEQGGVLFSISPAFAAPLDSRSRAQAQANLARAEAAFQAALTQVDAAQVKAELANKELRRVEALVTGGHLPQENLDKARAEASQADAGSRSARFAVEVARHERENARVTLAVAGGTDQAGPVSVTAPVSGLVLTRQRQSEGSIQAGETVLTLGDLASLDIEVDVLSPDAVRLRPGMRVELERWGGDRPLPGRVRRIEPAGFTRYSALGVEEQRVWVIVDIIAERDDWQSLGDGYRVEARFVLWEAEDVLQAPASALFREDETWMTYVIANNRAHRRQVTPGRRSGLTVEILAGLQEGEQLVMHPGQDIEDNRRVKVR